MASSSETEQVQDEQSNHVMQDFASAPMADDPLEQYMQEIETNATK